MLKSIENNYKTEKESQRLVSALSSQQLVDKELEECLFVGKKNAPYSQVYWYRNFSKIKKVNEFRKICSLQIKHIDSIKKW